MISKVLFLSTEDLVAIHRNTIKHEGGADGLRDRGLLESAAMMPQQSFFGEDLHPSIHSKAAAYLFHICKNHPFVDGNKRVAALTALIFLKENGIQKLPEPKKLRDATLAVADGSMPKEQLIGWFEKETS